MEKKGKLWFRNKFYGWGWRPASWEGWLVTLLYAAFVMGVSLKMSLDMSYGFGDWARWLMAMAGSTALLAIVAMERGEEPEWRWAGKRMLRR